MRRAEHPGPIWPPLAVFSVVYLVGTAAGILLGGPWWLTAGVGATVAVAALLARLAPTSTPLLLAAIALAGAGHARWQAHDAAAPPPIAGVTGIHVLTGIAREDPIVRGRLARIDLDIEAVDGRASSGGLRLTMLAQNTPVRAGERIRVAGEVEPPPTIEGFDYAGYLRSRGIVATVAYPQRVEIVGDGWPRWRLALRNIRRQVVSNIERALPEPASALAAGILIGSAARYRPRQQRTFERPARPTSSSSPARTSPLPSAFCCRC